MAQTRRNLLLKRLGIEVWVPRVVAQAPTAGSPSRAMAETPAAALGTPPPPRRRAVADERRPAPSVPAAAPIERTAPPADSRGDELPACRFMSLRVSGALLVCEARDLSVARRLGRDLLASCVGATGAQAEETLFDWDPDAIGSARVSGRRALAAFVRRQLDELGEGLLVVSETVLATVPDAAGAAGDAVRLVRIPELLILLDQPDAKRTLWQQIQSLAG